MNIVIITCPCMHAKWLPGTEEIQASLRIAIGLYCGVSPGAVASAAVKLQAGTCKVVVQNPVELGVGRLTSYAQRALAEFISGAQLTESHGQQRITAAEMVVLDGKQQWRIAIGVSRIGDGLPLVADVLIVWRPAGSFWRVIDWGRPCGRGQRRVFVYVMVEAVTEFVDDQVTTVFGSQHEWC